MQITFFKKSKFESGFEELIQLEILVELGVKLAESHYESKSKKKTFTALKRSTNLSGLKLSLTTPLLLGIECVQL